MITELQTGLNSDPVRSLPIDALPTSGNGWPFRPFQIVSLLEMFKVYGHAFYWLGSVLAGVRTSIKQGDPEVRDHPIPEDTVKLVFEKLTLAKKWSETTGLNLAVMSIDRMLALPVDNVTFSQMREASADVEMRVGDQLKSELFLHLPKEQANLFNNPPLLSQKAMRKFPRVAEDIQEAAKCLAIARYTACVFHLMRVMEIGVQRFGKKLKISIPVEEREWGKILGAINGEIKRLPYTTPHERKVRNGYSEASAFLENVKDAWRNPTMHPKGTYTEEEADHVYRFVKRYMEHLAKIF